MGTQGVYDLIVIGGGINGTGIARDAAGRGLSVALLEQGDLASATSSVSSKLIHGGLRYLEQYHFRLVRECLAEREILLRAAPHLVSSLRFVLPLHECQRPASLIRAGLFLYDHLGGASVLPKSEWVDLRVSPFGRPLRPGATRAALYSDCWGDDCRLVVSNAVDAARLGCAILTRTRVVRIQRTPDAAEGFDVHIVEGARGGLQTLRAKALVNAAGPWARDVHQMATGRTKDSPDARHVPGLRLVKGSHIVVPRLYEGDQAYILQNDDHRVVFVIPYENGLSLVGTTEIIFTGEPDTAAIDPTEMDYLCVAVNRYFQTSIGRESVVWAYSGVRPLFDDGSENVTTMTRDHVLLEEDGGKSDQAPLISVFGGKLTTYRRLSETVLARLARRFPGMDAPWTATAPLPGGDFGPDGMEVYLHEGKTRWPWLPPSTLRRYVRSYGTRTEMVVGKAHSLAEMGADFGAGLYETELDYLAVHEFARTADDVLWRRGKLGLHLSPAARSTVIRALRDRGGFSAPWEHDVPPVGR